MSAEIVNLRAARKARSRAERERQAEASRRLHGMSRAERKKLEAEREQARSRLDGHRREPDPAG